MSIGVELLRGFEFVLFAQWAGLVTDSVFSAAAPSGPHAIAVPPEAVQDFTPCGHLRAADVEFAVVHLPASGVFPSTPQSIDALRQQHSTGNVSFRLPSINTALAVEAFGQAVAQGFVSPDEGPQPTPVTATGWFARGEREPQGGPSSPTLLHPGSG